MSVEKKPLVIAIAGASGSGKTTLARALQDFLGKDHALLLHHDNYYRDRSELTTSQRAQINYDHPDALETTLLIEHLSDLHCGRSIAVPAYDFDSHGRSRDTCLEHPRPVVIVEGILVLADADLRQYFDLQVFVDVDMDICFMRRLCRDMASRGRSVEAVIGQYMATVRPMYQMFVLPSKSYADVVVPQAKNKAVVAMIAGMIQCHQGDAATP